MMTADLHELLSRSKFIGTLRYLNIHTKVL